MDLRRGAIRLTGQVVAEEMDAQVGVLVLDEGPVGELVEMDPDDLGGRGGGGRRAYASS